jgi:hypothetical protein
MLKTGGMHEQSNCNGNRCWQEVMPLADRASDDGANNNNDELNSPNLLPTYKDQVRDAVVVVPNAVGTSNTKTTTTGLPPVGVVVLEQHQGERASVSELTTRGPTANEPWDDAVRSGSYNTEPMIIVRAVEVVESDRSLGDRGGAPAVVLAGTDQMQPSGTTAASPWKWMLSWKTLTLFLVILCVILTSSLLVGCVANGPCGPTPQPTTTTTDASQTIAVVETQFPTPTPTRIPHNDDDDDDDGD